MTGRPWESTRRWDATEHLDTPESIAHYLEAAFEDGDAALIRAALGDVARSRVMTATVLAGRGCGGSADRRHGEAGRHANPNVSSRLGNRMR